MGDAARAWAEGLESWAIPPHIRAAAPQDPWALPVGPFVRAVEDAMERSTPSFRHALEAMPVGGTVLDVGCGAGAASVPLAPPASKLVGIDQSRAMLAAFTERAAALGIAHQEIHGTWPEAMSEVAAADVVVCHHVLYNVADLEPFVLALDARARRRVVIEITAEHPRSWMNPLWRTLHGIDRPTEPVATDAYDVLIELGIDARIEMWKRPAPTATTPLEELVAFTRVALCLPADRDPDVARAIAEHPVPTTRGIVTIWWDAG